MRVPNRLSGYSIMAILIANLTLGLTGAAHAQKKNTHSEQKKEQKKERSAPATEPATLAAEAVPCDKSLGFCPARPCSATSVLCIEASDRGDAAEEKSYSALTDPKNADLKKVILETPSNEAQRHEPPKGGFYTFLTVKNEFEDGNIIRACAGSKTGAFTIANISIDYKGSKGSSPVSFVPSSPLFIHANTVDVAKNVSAKGCTFKSASSQLGPYVLYSSYEPGQEEYTLHLKTTAGVIPPATHFAMFAKLATSVSAVWPGFIAISQPAGALATTVAADLDQLNAEAAVTSNIEYSAVLTPDKRSEKRDAGMHLQIWSPRLGEKKNSGFIEISETRSASIVIDSNQQNEWISPEDVLSNTGLGSPHRCIPGTGVCDKEQLFIKALNTDFALYGDFKSVAKSPSDGASQGGGNGGGGGGGAGGGGGGNSKPKSGSENWNTVFETCEKIRSLSSDLGLTAIDAQLVRWAMLQRAKLLDVLRDYQNGGAPDYRPALEKTSRAGLSDPYKQCWDAGVDDKRMHAIQSVMAKKFSPAIPEEVASKQ